MDQEAAKAAAAASNKYSLKPTKRLESKFLAAQEDKKLNEKACIGINIAPQ